MSKDKKKDEGADAKYVSTESTTTGSQSAADKAKLDKIAPAAKFGALGDNANAPFGKLHLMVDLESRHVGVAQMKSGLVGHTWVSLEPNRPGLEHQPESLPEGHRQKLKDGGKYADSMGMWPDNEGKFTGGQRVGYSSNPFSSYVQGRMKNPDNAHEGAEKATMTYPVTLKQATNALKYADSKRSARYSVFYYNCTDFAKELVAAAGHSAPNMTSGGIAMPDKAYDGILEWAKQDKVGAKVKGGKEDNEAYVNEGDLGITWEQVPVPPELAGLIDKPNMLKVKDVKAGGPGEGKVAIGDRVLKINGIRCNSEMTAKRAAFGKFGESMMLGVVDEKRMETCLAKVREAGSDVGRKKHAFSDFRNSLTKAVKIIVGRPTNAPAPAAAKKG